MPTPLDLRLCVTFKHKKPARHVKRLPTHFDHSLQTMR